MKVRKFLFGALPESTSPSGELNTTDHRKAARLFLVSLAGAVATAALDFLVKYIAGVNLGAYSPLIMPIITYGVEYARRYIAQHFPPAQ